MNADPVVESVADPLRVHQRAVGAREHQVVITPSSSDREALGRLALPVLTQSGDRDRVQVDCPSTSRCLRRAELRDVRDHDDRLADRRGAGVEVDVTPPEAQRLPSPATGRGQQTPQGHVPVAYLSAQL
jgi:hypothetical protein